MSGIFIIPHNAFPFEKFEWYNKERIFHILKKHQKSGVIFLSGDIHYAINTESACESLVTGYRIPEFTSSGLTHTNGDWMWYAEECLSHLNFQIYTQTEPRGEINYGNIHVNTETLVVTVEIRNLDDGIIWSRKFDLNKDLVYNSRK